MRRIAHISDLHFGRHDERKAEALLSSLQEQSPDLVVVSGDLTQRARRVQFEMARAFLDAVRAPVLVVPGNHDVPLYDLVRRFLRPLRRFRRLVEAELSPYYADPEIAVLGLNTARSSALRNGRLSLEQMALIGERFAQVPASVFKVLVTHHPFVASPRSAGVGRGALALRSAEAAGVHLLLAGHYHRGFTGDTGEHFPAVRRAILVVHAGTALSTRLRGEPNAYNLITLELPRLTCVVHAARDGRFEPAARARYELHHERWHPLAFESVAAAH